jgi:hypothetical protein
MKMEIYKIYNATMGLQTHALMESLSKKTVLLEDRFWVRNSLVMALTAFWEGFACQS